MSKKCRRHSTCLTAIISLVDLRWDVNVMSLNSTEGIYWDSRARIILLFNFFARVVECLIYWKSKRELKATIISKLRIARRFYSNQLAFYNFNFFCRSVGGIRMKKIYAYRDDIMMLSFSSNDAWQIEKFPNESEQTRTDSLVSSSFSAFKIHWDCVVLFGRQSVPACIMYHRWLVLKQ